jgi:hypothetical protein
MTTTNQHFCPLYRIGVPLEHLKSYFLSFLFEEFVPVLSALRSFSRHKKILHGYYTVEEDK